MTKVNVYLSVANNNSSGWAGDNGTLYEKEIDFSFLPSKGDEIHIAPGSDPEGRNVQLEGPRLQVRRIYWDANGAVHMELERLRVDPTQRMVDDERRYGEASHITWKPWWTKSDGPIEPILERGGWRKY